MNCSQCQTQNQPKAKFCMECGHKLEWKCANCKTSNVSEAKFCIECGQRPTMKSPELAPAIQSAQRRQLTVLFCDLVGSTALSNQLDVEEYRQLILGYHQVAEKVVKRYGGHVAQYLGDGLMVYFGYPQGLENASKAAIMGGLGILDAMGHANQEWQKKGRPELAIRIGIHTGEVVVDNHLALGETTNIAARLEGLAAKNTLVISPQTYKLAAGWFEVTFIGAHTIKGIPEPLKVFRVLHQTDTKTRLDFAKSRGYSPLIGRKKELNTLKEAWKKVKSETGQFVLISGPGGTGKSRLLEAAKEIVLKDSSLWMREFICSAYHQNSTFYPLIKFLENQIFDFSPAKSINQKLDEIEGLLQIGGIDINQNAPLIAELLSIDYGARYIPIKLPANVKKLQLLESLIKAQLYRASQQPVVLIMEDLHWADPSTLDFVKLFIESIQNSNILVIATTRTPKAILQLSPHITHIPLSELREVDIEAIILHKSNGKKLPEEVVELIKDRTDGVPFYIEEMTEMFLESGLLEEAEFQYELIGPLDTAMIPTSLQDSLTTKLDRLSTERELVQMAAVVGKEFSIETLTKLCGQSPETVIHDLKRLESAEIIVWHQLRDTYTFRHALIQEAAYNSLLKNQKVLWHRKLALVLEQNFPHIGIAQPEILAHHLTESKDYEKGILKWQEASNKAINQYAHPEAHALAKKGLNILHHVKDLAQRNKIEYNLRMTYQSALIFLKGYGAKELEESYKPFLELAKKMDSPRHLYLANKWHITYLIATAQFEKASRLLEEFKQIPMNTFSLADKAGIDQARGMFHIFIGKYKIAKSNFEQSISLYSKVKGSVQEEFNHGRLVVYDPAYKAFCGFLLGEIGQSFKTVEKVTKIALKNQHPIEVYKTHAYFFFLLFLTRQYKRLAKELLQPLQFAHRNRDKYWLGIFSMFDALTKFAQGQEPAGKMAYIIIQKIVTVMKCHYGFFMCLFIQLLLEKKQYELAETYLNQVWQHLENHKEGLCLADTHRFAGIIALKKDKDEVKAAAYFEKAITIAQTQESKWFELVATKDLAVLWQKQGKVEDAHNLLSNVYNQFTEGFEVKDMQEAKKIIAALNSETP